MRLSRDFTLEEMPCWERASPADVAALEATVHQVLQPVRDRFGPTVVTSWRWWRDGCTPRTGAHAGGGTVDFVPLNAALGDVFAWGLENLDRRYVGRWILEPDHIHVAPRSDMVEAFGPSKGDSLAAVEGPPGSYWPVPEWGGATGAPMDPIEIEGLTVTVSRPFPTWLTLFLAGLGFGIILRLTSEQE